MKELNEYLQLKNIEQFRQFIKSIGQVKELRKNEFFFRQGNIYKHLGYIESGAVRYLSYTSEGKDQIVGYSFENDFVSDYGTFMQNKPTVVDVQAIKNSTVWIITQDELMSFFQNHAQDNFRSKLAEIFLGDVYNRMLSLYCDTPKERYVKLITKYPEILNQVSLKEIASFIKITPETLSRIRKSL